jgi:hypothetical protein
MTGISPYRGRFGPALVLSVVILAAACGSDDIVDPDPGPALLSFTVLENPHNAISARAVVEARGVDSAFVRFWRSGGPARVSPRYGFGGDSVAVVPVLGLDAEADYTIELGLVIADSVAAGADTAQFRAGTIPAWVPRPGVAGTDTTPGLLALSFPDGPVIVDNTGTVVWYRYLPNGRLNSFQAWPDGRYTLMGLDDPDGHFHVLDDLGEEVGSLGCVDRPTRFHDLRIERDGSVWFLCDELRIMDLTAVGGEERANVLGTVVQRVGADGTLLREWNAFDFVEVTELPLELRSGLSVNLTHGNGITRDHEGNLLLSLRSLHQILLIDTLLTDVLWRFGGARNEFTLVNDPKGSFFGQHGIRFAAPGILQLLDNGSEAPSRLVRYLLDGPDRTAQLVSAFIDAPETFTNVGGASDTYANGHGLVTFGVAGRVVEVDEAFNRAWELTGLDSLYIFRAVRIPSLYAPERAASH